MRWLRVGAACASLFAASYASAAPREGHLGQALSQAGGARPKTVPAPAALGFGAASGRSTGAARSYGRALAGLQPETRAATRGAKETHVYQAAAPSVVLIVTDDALGSGVLISADGKIVTNLHVVGKAKDVGVIFKPAVEGAAVGDADLHRAKVLRRDEVSDLALIQVSEIPGHVKPLAIGSSASVQVGEDVHAIGHPTGEAWTYTRGIVSQIRRDYQWTAEDKLKHEATVIQTQTPINPGNSGGPLIDDDLQLIGINSFKGEGEGLNFAVSAEDVRAFLARAGDRATEPVKEGPPANCKEKAVDERVSKDPVGREYLIDEDCDGKGDYRLVVPDSKRDPIMVMRDDDHDGRLDAVIMDADHDGHPDLSMYDTDGDGKLDMEGRYHNGEDEPYRYKRLKD